MTPSQSTVDVTIRVRRWARNRQTILARDLTPDEIAEFVDQQYTLHPRDRTYVIECAGAGLEKRRIEP
jgi:hypothetical protein